MTSNEVVTGHASALNPAGTDYGGVGFISAPTYSQRKMIKRANDRALETWLRGRNSLTEEIAGRAVDTAKIVSAATTVAGIERARHAYLEDLISNAADEGAMVVRIMDTFNLPPEYLGHLMALAEDSQKAAADATTRGLLGVQAQVVSRILTR